MENKILNNISIIVAIARNYVIGKNNKLLWHIPDDLKRFKKITFGHSIIMGRNTYFSLPIKPLPGRRNIVITDIKDEKFPDCDTVYSIEEAIENVKNEKEAFIIGGASIYRVFYPIAKKIYLTFIEKDFEGDVYFPKINFNEWDIIEEINIPYDDNLGFSYKYITLIRNILKLQ